MTQPGCALLKESAEVTEETLLKTRSQIKFGSKIKNLISFNRIR